MFSPLLDILFNYGGAVLAGIASALLGKLFIAAGIQKKIRGYQAEIVKSHAKILELEAYTDTLEKKVKSVEKLFPKEQLSVN